MLLKEIHINFKRNSSIHSLMFTVIFVSLIYPSTAFMFSLNLQPSLHFCCTTFVCGQLLLRLGRGKEKNNMRKSIEKIKMGD